MQPHCPSRKRSLRSAQTCEEKSCICSDWGIAEMTPKSPAVRQASITVDGHVANGRAGRTSAWESSIGERVGNCAVSYHCAPVRRPPRLASGTSVQEENDFVRESVRFVAATVPDGLTAPSHGRKRASIQNAYSRTNGAVTFRKRSRTEEGAGCLCALAWLGFALLP